jgi:hypothetical protein
MIAAGAPLDVAVPLLVAMLALLLTAFSPRTLMVGQVKRPLEKVNIIASVGIQEMYHTHADTHTHTHTPPMYRE